MKFMNRRSFTKSAAIVISAAALPVWAQGRRNLKIGHTGITWPSGQGGRRAAPPAPPAAAGAPPAGAPPAPPPPAGPRPVNTEAIENIFRDISSLGFYGLELFNYQIEGTDAAGQLAGFIDKYKLPLISSYTGINLTDPAQRKTTIEAAVTTARVVKKNGGKIIVVGPNGVQRANYVFADHKADIVTTLNEAAKAIVEVGVTPVLHQHTGTCIESRDETYAVMEAVDTRVLKFGPDIGQLQKGGSDPVQVVKDFLPIVHHMHLKDFVGGEAFVGYCPLGQGRVDIPAILAMMDGRSIDGMIMVELDGSQNMPTTPLESATIAKNYLLKQGVAFRA